ncbi:MAG: hypothetical protein AAGH83_05345 [Pseudomonadota bacterium]
MACRFAVAGLLGLAACAPPSSEPALRLFPEGSAEDHAVCASVLVITTALAREEVSAYLNATPPSNDRIAQAGVSVLETSPDPQRSVMIGTWMLGLPGEEIIPFVIQAQPTCSERYPGFYANLGLL